MIRLVSAVGVALCVCLGVPAAASADVFPPNPFPRTGYGECTISGERVNMSVSYRDKDGDSSLREVGKVYLSGPLSGATIRARLRDSVTGEVTRRSTSDVRGGFSANVDFDAEEASPGSKIRVRVATPAGTCSDVLVLS